MIELDENDEDERQRLTKLFITHRNQLNSQIKTKVSEYNDVMVNNVN